MRIKDYIEENLLTWLADKKVDTIEDLKGSCDSLLAELKSNNKKLKDFQTNYHNSAYYYGEEEPNGSTSLYINIDYVTIPTSSNFGHLSHSHGDAMEKKHRFELDLNDIKRAKRDIRIENLLKEL